MPALTPTPLVILDRDGVINEESDQYIKTPSEWIPLEGSLQAIARLNKAGFHVAVATNQDAMSRGLYDAPALQKIHTRMHQAVSAVSGRLDAVYFCPHGAEAKCSCRKPEPGMLSDCIRRFGAEASQVYVVGDRWRDLIAAAKAGCMPILVRTGYGLKTLAEHESGSAPMPAATQVFDSLASWVEKVLSGEKS